MQLSHSFFVEIGFCAMKKGGEEKSLFWFYFQQNLFTAKRAQKGMVKIKGLNRLMRAVLFNIQIRELDVGKLSIDLRKWVYHGKRIV